MKLYALIFALGISSQALAADITIEMLNKDADGNKMVFSEEIVRIGVGDTVTWVPTDKGHNVEMVSSPNDMKFKSKIIEKFRSPSKKPGFIITGVPHIKVWA